MIDLTKLKGIELRRLNHIGWGLKKEYSEAIFSTIEKTDFKNYFWHPFFSKNTYVCNAYDSVVRYFYILNYNRPLKAIKIYDIHVSKALLKLCKQRGVKVTIEKTRSNKIFRFGIIKFILWFFIDKTLYKLSRHRVSKEIFKSGGSNKFVICETVYYKNTYSDQSLKDRHFFNTFNKLNEQGVGVVIFPFVYGFFNYYNLYRKVIKTNLEHVFLASFTKFTDLINVLSHVKSLRKVNKNFIINGVDFSDVANRSIKRLKYKPSSLVSVLKYIVTKRFALEKLPKKTSVLKWFEGSEVDRMSVLGWREVGGINNLIGYYDAFPPNNYLSPYLFRDDFIYKLVPDHLFFISEAVKEDFVKNVSSDNVHITGSLRIDLQNEEHTSNDFNLCLAVLPFDSAVAKYIFQLIVDIASDLPNDLQLIIRPHPSDNAVYEIDSTKVLVERNTPFNKLLVKADFVIGNSSSTVTEAYLNNKKVGLVQLPGELSSSPIPMTASLDFVREIFDADDLLNFLRLDSTNTIRNHSISLDKKLPIDDFIKYI